MQNNHHNSQLFNKEIYLNAKSWPFVEAKKILERIKNTPPEKGYVLFETGYGPSGLPHIGTFGEVARTSMVRFAFEQLSGIKTRLIVFSDDLDGLRKVPSNVPNQEMLTQHLGKPLTQVPDPFEKYSSFGEHNNAKLREFLDSYNFEYEFFSATECYTSGMFDKALLRVLEKYEAVKNVVLPTLGSERQSNYSPFLPIDPLTNEVLQVEVTALNYQKGTITYKHNTELIETSVIGGKCKLQWKADWAMRWYALNVDYEMSGKDLIESVKLSTKICKLLGEEPPLNFTYELFLDKDGQKISKSKGNGVSVEEWFKYANNESLSIFMYQKPQTAKRLYFEIIPKSVDEWLLGLTKYKNLTETQKVEEPLFFIHKNNPPLIDSIIEFSLILNLITTTHATDKQYLWSFIEKYKTFDSDAKRIIEKLLGYAIAYYQDFVEPSLIYKVPNDAEKAALQLLVIELTNLKEDVSVAEIQNKVYQVGKNSGLDLKNWFKSLYEILLGQATGPRIGTFFALYGLKNSIALINKVLST